MASLAEIAFVLGCSKPSVSLIRNGKYPAKDEALIRRYEALLSLIQKEIDEAKEWVMMQVCNECNREECTGCRIAEIL